MPRPFAFLLLALPALAAEPPKLPPGEQLPDGAVARLGSPRFRHAGLRDFVWLDGGKSIATVGDDATIRVWDAATGVRTRATVLKGAAGGVAFAFSVDGKRLAVGAGAAVTVVATTTGEALATLEERFPVPPQLGFAPDGRRVFINRDRAKMSVWDWQAGKDQTVPVAIPQWGTDSTFHAHFSPDGKRFVAGVQANQPLVVFDTATWEKVHELDCYAACSTFTPDGKRLVVGSLQCDGKRGAVIMVFDADTGKELHKYKMGHPNIFFSLAVSPDGKTLACGASDRSCLLDLESGKVLHPLPDRPFAVAFSPDGKTLAASEWGMHLRVWDVATGKERFDEVGNFGPDLAAAASPDGRLLAAAAWMDREVTLWDTPTGKVVRRYPLRGSGRYTRDVSFSADGRAVAAGMYEGFAQVWDAATGKELRYIELDRPALGERGSSAFVAVRVLPDLRRVATVERNYSGNQSTRVAAWDVATARPIWHRSYRGISHRFAWPAGGETLALATDTGVVLIDLETGEERARLEGSSRAGVTIATSPDGRLVAAARGKPGKETVGIHEVATGGLIAELPARRDVGIAADNRTVYAIDGTTLRAWDLATGKEVATRPLADAGTKYQGRTSETPLLPLAGRRVLTPMPDGTALVWDFTPPPPTGAKVDDKQLAAWWADLRDEPAKAYAAVWKLSEASADSVVPFLANHLRPEAAPDPAKLRQWVAELDGDRFPVRDRAARELEALGALAFPALRDALARKPSPEARTRIEQLLSRRENVAARPEQLRRLRAMQVLERTGTPAAKKVLADLAAGVPELRETREARAALIRLG